MITMNYYNYWLVNGKHWDRGTSLGELITVGSMFSKKNCATHITRAVVKYVN